MGFASLIKHRYIEGIKEPKFYRDIDRLVDELFEGKLSDNENNSIQLFSKKNNNFFKSFKFFYIRKTAVQIISGFMSIVLLLALFTSGISQINADSGDDVIILIEPNAVYNGETVHINISIPNYYNVSSFSADIGGGHIIDLVLFDNKTAYHIWTSSWVVNDMAPGRYMVHVVGLNLDNLTYSNSVEWEVLARMENDANDSFDDESNKIKTSDEIQNETELPEPVDVNESDTPEVSKPMHLSLSVDNASYVVNDTVRIYGMVMYNDTVINTSVTLTIIGPNETISDVLNVSDGLFNYSFIPRLAGKYVVNASVFYANDSDFDEFNILIMAPFNNSENESETPEKEEPDEFNKPEVDLNFWDSGPRPKGKIGTSKMDYDKAWKFILKKADWRLEAFVDGSWQSVDGLKIKYNKILDNLRKFSLEFIALVNQTTDYRLVLVFDLPVVDYDFDEESSKFTMRYVSYDNPWIFEYDYSDIAGLSSLVFDHDVDDYGRFWFSIKINNISYREEVVLDPNYGFIGDSDVSSFEWDTNQGEEVDAIRLGTSEYYLIAAAGSGDDGYLYTIRVWNSNGTIRQSVVDSWEYDTSDGQYPSLCYLEYTSGPARDYSIYALVYKDTAGGFGTSKIITVKVWSTNGTIWKTALDTLSVTSYLGNYHDIIHVTGDYYAFVSSSAADNDGFIKTVDIDDSNGAIGSIVDSVEFDTADCSYPRIVQVDSDTVAIVYSGPDQDGYLKTYNISAAGDITNTAADSWEFDTTYANYPFIKHISGDYFAIAYRDTDGDGWVKTVIIESDGDIDSRWQDTLEFEPSDCYYPYICEVEANDVYSIAYQGVSGDGFIKTVGITSGVIDDEVYDFYEFDTGDCQWYPNTIHVSGDYYLIVYPGPDSGITGYDGWSKTITIESSESKIFYFNSYEAGGEEWKTNPDSMIDGDINSFAEENRDRTVQLLNTNDCDGTNFGTISDVWIRAYGYRAGDAQTITLRPVFSSGDGDNHDFNCGDTPGDWSALFKITADTNAPPAWTWTEVQQLQCDVETAIAGDGTLYCSKVEIVVEYTNNAPTASYQSGADSVHYGGKQYSFTTRHTDSDGSDQIQYAYAAIGDANNDIQFRCDPNSGASPTVTVTSGSGYVIGTPTASRSSTTNGWDITWTYTIGWNWDHDDSPVIDYYAYTTDDHGLNSGWDQEILGYNYENELIIYSITQYTLNNSAYSEDGNTNLTENEWFRGGVQVKCSGVVTYEDTTNEYPPTTAVDVQLWANGVNLGSSYQNNTLGASGEFETPYYTTTSAPGNDSDFDFNVSLVNFTSGAAQGTGQTTTLRNSSRDNEAPTSSIDAITPYQQTSSQITLNSTDASDGSGSGLKNITLWYRFSSDNSSWNGWVQNITQTSPPWQWTFNFTQANDTGYYEFYSIAADNVSNIESAPGSADAICYFNPDTTINITPSVWNIGDTTIGNYNYSTSGFYFNLTNNGTVTLDIQIKASNATNSTTGAEWILSSTPGFNNYSLQYNKSISDPWVNINQTYDTFVSNLAAGFWQRFDLNIFMATSSTKQDPREVEVTFRSVAS